MKIDTEYKFPWIPCDKLLPEDLESNRGKHIIQCIVSLKPDRYCHGNVQKRQRQQLKDYDGNFIDEWEWSRIDTQRINAWYPMPEYYKEETK